MNLIGYNRKIDQIPWLRLSLNEDSTLLKVLTNKQIKSQFTTFGPDTVFVMKLWMYFSFCPSVAIKTFHWASKVLLRPSVLSLSWWKYAMRSNHFQSPRKRYAVEMFWGVVICDENCLWLAINLSSMADYVDMCKAIISQFPLRHSLKSVLLVTSCPMRFDKEAHGKKWNSS